MIIVKVKDFRYDQLWYAGKVGRMYSVKPSEKNSDLFVVLDEVDEEGAPRTMYRRDCDIVDYDADSALDLVENAPISAGGDLEEDDPYDDGAEENISG